MVQEKETGDIQRVNNEGLGQAWKNNWPNPRENRLGQEENHEENDKGIK